MTSTQTRHSPAARIIAYLQLARPANIVTALADVMAGFAAAGIVAGAATPALEPAGWALAGLLGATTGLYGGGVVFNDVFDAELDAEERPERPIPSGRVSKGGAAVFGGVLLLAGIALAALVSLASGLLAAGIAAAALLYDRYGKHHAVAGPLNMGLCRGGNLLLGVSAAPAMLGEVWFLALLPIVYIAAITMISRGEVHGGSSQTGWLAVAAIALVLAGLLALGARSAFALWEALPFALLLAYLVVPTFVRAARTPEPDTIRRAVKSGILALIPLNAVLAAGFGGWLYGLLVLALLPLSYGLARLFDVT